MDHECSYKQLLVGQILQQIDSLNLDVFIISLFSLNVSFPPFLWVILIKDVVGSTFIKREI